MVCSKVNIDERLNVILQSNWYSKAAHSSKIIVDEREELLYTSNYFVEDVENILWVPETRYGSSVQQYSAAVQYAAPVQQYSAPMQYSAPVQQYAPMQDTLIQDSDFVHKNSDAQQPVVVSPELCPYSKCRRLSPGPVVNTSSVKVLSLQNLVPSKTFLCRYIEVQLQLDAVVAQLSGLHDQLLSPLHYGHHLRRPIHAGVQYPTDSQVEQHISSISQRVKIDPDRDITPSSKSGAGVNLCNSSSSLPIDPFTALGKPKSILKASSFSSGCGKGNPLARHDCASRIQTVSVDSPDDVLKDDNSNGGFDFDNYMAEIAINDVLVKCDELLRFLDNESNGSSEHCSEYCALTDIERRYARESLDNGDFEAGMTQDDYDEMCQALSDHSPLAV